MIIKIQLGLRNSTHTFSTTARFLAIQLQQDVPTIWLDHGSSQPQSQYQILQLMAGEDSPPDTAIYVDTLQIKWLVIHYYALKVD